MGSPAFKKRVIKNMAHLFQSRHASIDRVVMQWRCQGMVLSAHIFQPLFFAAVQPVRHLPSHPPLQQHGHLPGCSSLQQCTCLPPDGWLAALLTTSSSANQPSASPAAYLPSSLQVLGLPIINSWCAGRSICRHEQVVIHSLRSVSTSMPPSICCAACRCLIC